MSDLYISPNIASLLWELYPKALWDVFLVAVGSCGCSEGDFMYLAGPHWVLWPFITWVSLFWSVVCWAVTWKGNCCCLSIRIRCLWSCRLGLCCTPCCLFCAFIFLFCFLPPLWGPSPKHLLGLFLFYCLFVSFFGKFIKESIVFSAEWGYI